MDYQTQIKQVYDEIKQVFNPFFQENILFNYSGWNHLLKDGNGIYRPKDALEERLKLIQYLPILLNEKVSPIEPKIKFNNGLIIRYYSWIFTVDSGTEQFRIKIIVRQKGVQPKHFYSCFKLIHTQFVKP
jgi:hypothetical protein